MSCVCASSAGMTLRASPTTGYVNSCRSAQRRRHHGHAFGLGQMRWSTWTSSSVLSKVIVRMLALAEPSRVAVDERL